jgi:hypothetical protein
VSEDAGVPMREETLHMARERLLAAIGALIRPDAGTMAMDSPVLKPHQGWRGWLVRSRGRP